ncbi:hypothetical protein [Singulisphaera sp. PoT]|uniref:hypothetical protein n=1 Tax=Singulisphaera sp. PoT TaxID=3411797 RepID=UPI003BF4B5D2
MRFDGVSKDVRYQELVSEFPLMSIHDDATYRLAIEILDRLFILDRKRTGELEYFRQLAYLAYRYEQMTGMCDLRESNHREGVLA